MLADKKDQPTNVMLIGNPELIQQLLIGLGNIKNCVFWLESCQEISGTSLRFWQNLMQKNMIVSTPDRDQGYILILAKDKAEAKAYQQTLPPKLPGYTVLLSKKSSFNAKTAMALATKIAEHHIEKTLPAAAGKIEGTATAEDKATASYRTALPTMSASVETNGFKHRLPLLVAQWKCKSLSDKPS